MNEHTTSTSELRIKELERRLVELTQDLDSVKHKVGAAREIRSGSGGGPNGTTLRLGILSGTLTARSGKVPGTGTVQPYVYDGSNLVTSGPTETVLNWTGSTASGVWIEYGNIYDDGRMWFNGNDCSGVTP